MSFPQTRPMVTRQRRGYGPGVWSTWTELRSSRTISKIKKNRGKSLSRSHRAMTSMCAWSSPLSESMVESVGCKVIVWYALCICVLSRSDSDSEGENPERKKLQEQLMGKEMKICASDCFCLCDSNLSQLCLNGYEFLRKKKIFT